MDTRPTPPACPFQYDGSDFYDQPSRDATAIWLAAAFLTTVDYSTDTITAYDGVAWGFSVNPVPVPASPGLAGAGLIVCVWVRRKRRSGVLGS